jgi:hypothetical protein
MARKDKKLLDSEDSVELAAETVEEAPSMEHPKPTQIWSNFDQFWFDMKTKHSLKEGLKDTIKKYFEAKNIKDPSQYEEGLKKFGIK